MQSVNEQREYYHKVFPSGVLIFLLPFLLLPLIPALPAVLGRLALLLLEALHQRVALLDVALCGRQVDAQQLGGALDLARPQRCHSALHAASASMRARSR